MIRFKVGHRPRPLFLAARDAARRFGPRRGTVWSGSAAWRPMVLQWRRRPRRGGTAPIGRAASPATVVWSPHYHVHLAAYPGGRDRTERTLEPSPVAAAAQRPQRWSERWRTTVRLITSSWQRSPEPSPSRSRAVGAALVRRILVSGASAPRLSGPRTPHSPAPSTALGSRPYSLAATAGRARTGTRGGERSGLLHRSKLAKLGFVTLPAGRGHAEQSTAPRHATGDRPAQGRPDRLALRVQTVTLAPQRHTTRRPARAVSSADPSRRQFHETPVAQQPSRPPDVLLDAPGPVSDTRSAGAAQREEPVRTRIQRLELSRRFSWERVHHRSFAAYSPGAASFRPGLPTRLLARTLLQPRAHGLDARPRSPGPRAQAAGYADVRGAQIPHPRVPDRPRESRRIRFPFDGPEELVLRRGPRPTSILAEEGGPVRSEPLHAPSARSRPGQEAGSGAAPVLERAAAVPLARIDPALLDRLTDDVIRRVEQRTRIERHRRGL